MSALNNTELDGVMEQNNVTRKLYMGSFPACIFPKPKSRRYFFIKNTDQHDEPGTHWTAWLVDGDNIEFFDSFGRSPTNKHFPKQFRDYVKGKSVLYSTFRVQKYSSSTCGYFCMYYIYFRSLGFKFDYIIKKLSNLNENDDIVVSFINSLL